MYRRRDLDYIKDKEMDVYRITTGNFLPSRYLRLKREIDKPFDGMYFFDNRDELAEYILRKNRMKNHLEMVKNQWIKIMPRIDATDYVYLPFAKSKLMELKRKLPMLGIDGSNRRFLVDGREIYINSAMGMDLIRIRYEAAEKKNILFLAIQTRIGRWKYSRMIQTWILRMIQTFDFIINTETEDVDITPIIYNLPIAIEVPEYGCHQVQSSQYSGQPHYVAFTQQYNNELGLDFDSLYEYGNPNKGARGCYRPMSINQESMDKYKIYEWYPSVISSYRKCTGRKNYTLNNQNIMVIENFCIVENNDYDVFFTYQNENGWQQGSFIYNRLNTNDIYGFIGCLNNNKSIYWTRNKPSVNVIRSGEDYEEPFSFYIGDDRVHNGTGYKKTTYKNEFDFYYDEYGILYTKYDYQKTIETKSFSSVCFDYDISPNNKNWAAFYRNDINITKSLIIDYKPYSWSWGKTYDENESIWEGTYYFYYSINGNVNNIQLAKMNTSSWIKRGAAYPSEDYYASIFEQDSSIEGNQIGNMSVHINDDYILYTYLKCIGNGDYVANERIIGFINIGNNDLAPNYTKEWVFGKLSDQAVSGLTSNLFKGGFLEKGEYKVMVSAFNPVTITAASEEILVNIDYIDPDDPEEFRSVRLQWTEFPDATGYIVFFGNYMMATNTNSIDIVNTASNTYLIGDIPNQNYKLSGAIGMEVK